MALRELAQLLMQIHSLKNWAIQIVLEDAVSAQISIDPQQIKQVLINLIQNAGDSIGHEGTVTLPRTAR